MITRDLLQCKVTMIGVAPKRQNATRYLMGLSSQEGYFLSDFFNNSSICIYIFSIFFVYCIET